MSKRIMILANDTTYVYNLRSALIKKIIEENNEIYIVAQVLNFEKELKDMGCNIINMSIGRHGTNPFEDLKIFKEYKKILKKIMPDIVLSYNIKPNVYGGMACAKYKIKFMPNITGLGTALEYPGIMQKITIVLNKIGLRKADTVFFQNLENQEFFLQHNILSNETKTVLLPGSGVDLEKNKLFEYPNDKIVKFLFIARIMKDKGIDIYLETAKAIKKKYPETEFHICGYCDDIKYKTILEEYEKNNIIIYHGEQKNMNPYFEMANCIIHPSYYPEGMSNVLLESAAHGRPIICTDRSGCKETVDNDKTGFIVPIKNISSVIDAAEKIVKMTYDERKKLGLNGRKKIEKEFDRQIVVDKYMERINAPKKIVYFGGFELPDKNAAAIRVIENGKILNKLGYHVVYAGITKDFNINTNIEKSYSMKYPKSKIDWIKYLTSAKQQIKIIKQEKPTAIILYNYQSISMSKIMKYCKNNGIKVYGDITEWYIPDNKGLVFKIIKQFDVLYRMKKLNKKLDGLILISKYLYDYYQNKNNNIVYIPMLTDSNNIKWKNNYLKEKDILHLVYAGNIKNKDSIDEVIVALTKVKRKCVFDVIGITREEFIENHRELELFLNDNIVFHGRLSNDETLEFIKKANYSIFFRENNIMTQAGFPSKFVESLSCNTPVITNTSSNISDYFKDNENGICIESVSIDQLVQILENIPSEMKVSSKVFDYNLYIDEMKRMLEK